VSLANEPCSTEVKVTLEKLKRYKSPGTDQNPAELLVAGGETLRSDIRKLINSEWNNKGLPQHCKESLIPFIYKKGDKTECNNYGGISVS
jgi:hypothetical protein